MRSTNGESGIGESVFVVQKLADGMTGTSKASVLIMSVECWKVLTLTGRS